MNLLEQQLDYPLGDTLPDIGSSLEVAPGVRWLRMALPFALDHINLWLLRDSLDGRDGWTVVDCCIDQPESRAQWDSVFATQLEGLPVLRVIVTHMHPDHIGLAHWLCERWSTPAHECRLWISATDYQTAVLSSNNISGFGGENSVQFFAAHGLVASDALDQIRQRTHYYSGMVPAVPRRYRRLLDGGVLRIGGRDWRCISGYGHAPEHIALYCDDVSDAGSAEKSPLLISGDMVLPRISTNISVFDTEPEADPLRLFLESIDKYLPLPEQTYTLPSHGKPFRGLHTRIGQLHDHHRERLAEVLQACAARPCSAADIVPVMFRRTLDLHQMTFAMGEAIAHLHLLWHGGELRRSVDAAGVFRFSTD